MKGWVVVMGGGRRYRHGWAVSFKCYINPLPSFANNHVRLSKVENAYTIQEAGLKRHIDYISNGNQENEINNTKQYKGGEGKQQPAIFQLLNRMEPRLDFGIFILLHKGKAQHLQLFSLNRAKAELTLAKIGLPLFFIFFHFSLLLLSDWKVLGGEKCNRLSDTLARIWLSRLS